MIGGACYHDNKKKKGKDDMELTLYKLSWLSIPMDAGHGAWRMYRQRKNKAGVDRQKSYLDLEKGRKRKQHVFETEMGCGGVHKERKKRGQTACKEKAAVTYR